MKLHWTDNCRVDYRSGRAIATAVGAGLGEEHNLVVFANNDERDFRGEAQFSAGLWCQIRKGLLGA